MELANFPGDLNTKELHNAITAKEELNEVLTCIRDVIEQRKREIYKPLEIPFTDEITNNYIKARSAWKIRIAQIKKCVEVFNDSVNKRKKLFEKTRRENELMARKLLATALKEYRKALTNEEQVKKNSRN